MKTTWQDLKNEYDELEKLMIERWPEEIITSRTMGKILGIADGYVRILRSEKVKKATEYPSERICERVLSTKKYIVNALSENDPDLLLQIGEKVAFSRFHHTPTVKFVHINSQQPFPVNGNYCVFIPTDWVRKCNNRDCSNLYVNRFNSNYCCAECRRIEKNHRRQESRWKT